MLFRIFRYSALAFILLHTRAINAETKSFNIGESLLEISSSNDVDLLNFKDIPNRNINLRESRNANRVVIDLDQKLKALPKGIKLENDSFIEKIRFRKKRDGSLRTILHVRDNTNVVKDPESASISLSMLISKKPSIEEAVLPLEKEDIKTEKAPEPEINEIPETEPSTLNEKVESVPAPEIKTLNTITFESATADKKPRVNLTFSNAFAFTTQKQNSTEFNILISDFKSSGKHLLLPYFPPKDFDGLSVLNALDSEDGLKIKVIVEEGRRVEAFRDGSSLILEVSH